MPALDEGDSKRLQRGACVEIAYVSIRQHTSAYVPALDEGDSERLQRGARVEIAYVSIRQHTSAYDTSAYVSIRACARRRGQQASAARRVR